MDRASASVYKPGMPLAPRLNGTLAILVAALLWSSGGLFIKLAPMPGLLVVGGRAVVTSLFYFAVLRPDLRRANWRTAASYAGMILTFVCATKLTTAANAIVLQYTGTAWVLALAPRLLGEPLRRIDVVTVLACLGGVALCMTDAPPARELLPHATAGNVLGAISGLFYAGAVLGMRLDAQPGTPRDAQASVTLGNLLALAIALPPSWGDLPALASWRAVAVLLWLGLMQMGVAYLLFLRGLRTVPAATASLLALLEPAALPLWVLLGTGERPGAGSMTGGVVVLGALGARALALAWSERRRS